MLFTLPASKDKICFVSEKEGMKTYDEGQIFCQQGGFDGILELRHEKDTNYTAKLMYCGSDWIQKMEKRLQIYKCSQPWLSPT